jgi:hypothetical protein
MSMIRPSGLTPQCQPAHNFGGKQRPIAFPQGELSATRKAE